MSSDANRIELEEDDLFGETEADLPNLDARATFNAVVTATDWTTETLINQISRGNLELDPAFQRRDAWNRLKKSRFIESVVVGLPVPQVVLAERPGRRGEFVILDGKQRLLSLKQFYDGDYRLAGLNLRPELNGMTYQALPDDDRYALDTQTIRTVVVRNWEREEFLYLVFLRLNTANVPLSPQELRQALHPGPFVSFANEFTEHNPTFSQVLTTSRILRERARPDFRMRDVELLVRFFAFREFLPAYNGNLKDLLDTTCEVLNKQWELREREIQDAASECLLAIKAMQQIFGENAFRRWTGHEYERPFNRAIFDVLTFYAYLPSVRQGMLTHSPAVEEAFRKVCIQPEFQSAITQTTKSTEAIFTRLHDWGKLLGPAISIPLPLPVRARNGRIAYT